MILASKSPRRKQILEELGYTFQIIPSQREEVFDSSLSLDEALKKVARTKNLEIKEQYTDEIIVSADTIVCFQNKILGKPKDQEEAIDILTSLSGQVHEVKTGVCVSYQNQILTEVETTSVQFRKLSKKDILDYVNSGKCMDKAGAYGIQETDFVQTIHGSYSNVVGLPKQLVKELLLKIKLMD